MKDMDEAKEIVMWCVRTRGCSDWLISKKWPVKAERFKHGNVIR